MLSTGPCGVRLQELALEYLNEYIIHWPIAGNEGDTVEPSIQVICSAEFEEGQRR